MNMFSQITSTTSFTDSINDAVSEAQEKAVKELLRGLNLSDQIRGSVKSELMSRISYGMNLKKVEIFHNAVTKKDHLIFEVEI